MIARAIPYIALLVWAGALACGGEPPVETLTLVPGQELSRTLKAGGAHRWALEAPAGTFLRLGVEQQGIDLVVHLTGAGGNPRLTIDSPTGERGVEEVVAVTETAGVHYLLLEALDPQGAGSYVLRVEAARPATAADRRTARFAGARARAEEHRVRGERSAAVTAYQEALVAADHQVSEVALAEIRLDLGLELLALGRAEPARRRLAEAVAGFRAEGADLLEARALNDLGAAQRAVGRLGPVDGAEASYRRSFDLYSKLNNRAGQASAINNLGLVHERTGRLGEALTAYRQAGALWRSLGEAVPAAVTDENLGRLQALIGHDEEALRLLRQAVAVLGGQGDPDRLRSAQVALGWALYLAGEPEEAIELYGTALRARPAPLAAAGIIDRRATAFKALGRTREARAGYRRALSAFEEGGERLSAAHARANLGWVELEDGRLVAAGRHLAAALGTLAELGDPTGVVYVRIGLARLARRSGALDLAQEHLEAAAVEIDRVRRTLPGGLPRGLFLGAHYDATEELVSLWMERHRLEPAAGYDRKALQVAQSARSRSLLEGMVGEGTQVSVAQTKELLDEDTLLVVYLLAEPESFAWTLGRDGVESHRLPGREEVETLARRTARRLAASSTAAFAAASQTASRDLATAVLEPLAERLATSRRLVFLPDGALHRLPLGALPLGDPELPLLARHEVLSIPSVAVLAELRRRSARPEPPGTVAVLADPVFSSQDPRWPPGVVPEKDPKDGLEPFEGASTLRRLVHTAREASAVADQAPPGRRLVAEGFDAHRDQVEAGALSSYLVLHFATHGVLDPALPELSGLVLSRYDAHGRRREAFLSAPEVAALDLPADLVVLSACETGLGREVRGEGLVGLPQAFLTAGARRVVVSLWRIDDPRTADLMELFYRGLWRDHLPPAAALQQAQRALAAEGTAPAHWASFVLYGDWQ